MRSHLLNFISLLVVVGSACGQARPQGEHSTASSAQVVLPGETEVLLRTTRAITSKQAKPGEQIELEVTRDVRAGDFLIIPRHTPVTGTVTRIQPARRGMRGGSMGLAVGSVRAATGETIVLAGGRSFSGGPTSKEKADAVIEGEIILSWVPFLFKGEEAAAPKGTEVVAYVDGDITLDAARLRQAATLLEQKNAAARAAARTGKASIHLYRTSYGGKCTITLDGKPLVRLQGGRVFNLQLSPGTHIFCCQDHELAVDGKPDEDYYIRINAHPGVWNVRQIPVLIPGEAGEDEIYPLSPVDAKDVLGREYASQLTSPLPP